MSKAIFSNIDALNAPERGLLVVLVNEDGGVAAEIENFVGKAFLKRVIKARAFKGKKFAVVDALSEESQGFERLVLLGVGDVSQFKGDDWVKLGGVARASFDKNAYVTLCLAIADYTLSPENIVDFAVGVRLRDYTFDKYQNPKKDDEKKAKSIKINLQLQNPNGGKTLVKRADALADAVILARDLVNEPANILGPEEFSEKVKALKDLGVKVEIVNDKDMKKLGMNALLGVGRGSKRSPCLAIMQWQGVETKEPPLAFIGKGVVFDSGGISLKPSKGMEAMKGDMGGAAAVTGLIMALALRKAKVNAIGVIGLVENMPDGNAQRPGDIVTTMSGQTVEINNTDAEGRLVLADALWYVKERFQPKFMVDLATLTGAIIVSLGKDHAGLFSNNDDLAQKLTQAGLETGEKLWRFPLNDAYDKMIDSKFADMVNSVNSGAHSITAAQFLKRFVGETPWAHLDIAGTAMESEKNEYSQSWASGFGVRLLDHFIAKYYED